MTNEVVSVVDVSDYIRKKLWAETYFLYLQTRSAEVASKIADSAVDNFDKKFKL